MHKIFEKQLNNKLFDLNIFLKKTYLEMEDGIFFDNEIETETFYRTSNSISTMNFHQYNAFQFYNESIHNLLLAVRDMTEEACDYHKIDYKSQKFYTQAWFNLNYANKGKLDWHDHPGGGLPNFHGYYCVNAEPSVTKYIINDENFDIINKNNRAILLETGHMHKMEDWKWNTEPRITIAYDVVPLKFIQMDDNFQQHWIPIL